MYENINELIKKCFAKEDETIKEHTEKLIEKAEKLRKLNYISKEKFEVLKKSCLYHDIGKINPKFQERIRASKEGKKIFFDENKEVPHNILSYFLLNETIIENYEENYFLIYSIINHHKRTDNFKYIGENYKKIEENLLDILKEYNFEYICEIDDYIDVLDDIVDFIRDNSNPENKDRADIALGLLNKCDYAASANIEIEYPADFLNSSLENMMKKWKEIDSKVKWNKMQDYCFNNQDENLIIIAPTGSGKTEAALKWIGDNKGFFVLPLKTAINAIYFRVEKEILNGENIDKRLGLLHGDTLDIYNSSKENKTKTEEIMEYFDRTKMYCLPLNISTPDQLFNFIFKSNFYELKYAMLSYSKIVIDEIQSYSSDILASIIFGIHKIIKAGGKVSIFTATLPPFIKDFLNSQMNGEELKKVEIFKTIKNNEFLDEENRKRHFISVKEKELLLEDIMDHYENNKSDYKKYLVVCNTVKKAQELYLGLKDEGYENIYLLHSKFTKIDRSKKEIQILKDGQTFDKNREIKKQDVIWISTQIVEASLDIDFDYLFTELSDLSGLFQRMGRVNRKGKKEIKNPNCYIYTKINSKLLRNKANQKLGFIDGAIYRISKEALLDFTSGENKIITEKEKLDLIEKYLTMEKLIEKESAFIEEYNNSYKRLFLLNSYDMEIKNKFRNIISYDVFPVDEEKGIINEKEIEKCKEEFEILRKNTKDPNYLIKFANIKSKIKEYTVPVGLYDVKAGNINKEFEIGNSRIKYLICKYDSEIGYVRTYKEILAKYKNEEDIIKSESDSFI